MFLLTLSLEASITNGSVIPKEKGGPPVLRSIEKPSETKVRGFGVRSVERQVTAMWFPERDKTSPDFEGYICKYFS